MAFDVEQYIPKKEARKMDAFIHYGIAAGVQAIKDSGIEISDANAKRIGVAIGSGIGGVTGIENGYGAYLKGGPRKISPFFVPANIINMVAGNLSIMYGLKGPNISIVSACSTGAHNIGDAMRMIQYGTVDMMVAGGAEMATSPTGLGGFAAARALSTRNDDPQAPAARGIVTVTALCSATVPAFSCWKRWSMPRPAVRRSMPNWPVRQ